MKTKLIFTIIVLLLSAINNNISAQNHRFGLGIIIGEPTGLSGKLWTGNHTAIDGALAWSFGKKDALHIHGDMLFHDYKLIKVSEGKLPVYYGIGCRIKLEDETKIGIRIPVGLSYQFQNAPLDIFLEIVPILELIPATDFNMNGAIGVRYFFD
jgi:hypothetical protein